MKRITLLIIVLCVFLYACSSSESVSGNAKVTVETTAANETTVPSEGTASAQTTEALTVPETTQSTVATEATAVTETTGQTTAPTESTNPGNSDGTWQPSTPSTTPTNPPVTTPTTSPTTAPTTEPTTAPTAAPTTEPTTAPTEPEHSALYIPGVSVESVISWFNEVCLDAEFVNGGNASLVQKWGSPIYYTVTGDATAQDLQVLQSFCAQLNGIYGFPGIYSTTESWQSDLNIIFCPGSEFTTHLGPNFSGLDGGVTFWYDGANVIYDATICYRSDLDQYTRNSVILEEIYNGLGPVQDTWTRSDSIIYAGYSTPQSLTSVDWLLLKLLYHPSIQCGMNAAQCEQVIRSLYY